MWWSLLLACAGKDSFSFDSGAPAVEPSAVWHDTAAGDDPVDTGTSGGGTDPSGGGGTDPSGGGGTGPVDADADGSPVEVDCDDSAPGIHPGAGEACDGIDTNCDGVTDPAAPAACPDADAAATREGGGLVALDPSWFALADEGGWAVNGARIAALERTLPVVTPGQVFADGNRDADVVTRWSGATGFARGFTWNAGDDGVDYWMPQGVTGTFDSEPGGLVEGYAGVLVSWHYDPGAAGTSYDKGVRISFANVSGTGAVTYRHALLVAPTGDGSSASFEAVRVHAGGIAWVGPWLYVADTNHGLRVFDMRHILRVDVDVDTLGCDGGTCRAWNYRYVIPQVTRYAMPACGCEADFSFVALDRSSSPPSLVTGEYRSDSIAGKLLRWPLDPGTGLLAGGAVTRASEAWVAQQDRMQGAASQGGVWWVSCSSQSGSDGRVYRLTPGNSQGYAWVYGAEDLAIDSGNGTVWSCTEHPGSRAVFASRLSALGG
ncbi:MAG: hypothetical protein RLZZ299_178 [Pseudomonadota bacterium]